MAGRTLGEAWVTIRPDTAKFRTELTSKVNTSMKGYKPSVTVTVNLRADSAKLRTQLQTAVTSASRGLSASAQVKANVDSASVAKTKAAIDTAAKNRTAKITTDSDADKAAARYTAWWDKALNQRVLQERLAAQRSQSAEEAAAKRSASSYTTWWAKALDQQELKSRLVTDAMRKNIGSLDGQIEDYKKRLDGIAIRSDDTQSKAELNVLISKADVLKSTLGNITTNVGISRAIAQMAALNMAAEKFRANMSAKNAMPDLGLELTLAQSQFVHLERNAKSLKKEIESALTPGSITIGKVTEEAKNDLMGLRGGTEAVLREIDKIRSHGGPITSDDISRVKILTSGMSQLTSAVAADGVTVKRAGGSWRGWVNALISIARAQIPLFNGALEKMMPHFLAVASGTHILVEAALELVAVWVPAAMALTVFGLAAAKASLEVASDVKSMGIAANGTGQQFQGMAKKIGTSMSQIAKPYVFEAYGMALIALQKQSTTTAGVIRTVGSSIDRWISEAVIAYQKGTGQMAKKGANDFAILGDSFKQVGTIINGFIKMTPGYAEDLLKLGDGVLHLASAILNSGIAQGFGKIFLALHGALFYLGLFVTLGSKLGMAMLAPIARITGLSKVLGVLGVTSGATKGKMAELMSSIATGWQTGTGKAVKAVDEMGFPLQNAMAGNVEKATKAAEEKFTGMKGVVSGAMSGMGSKVATAAKGIKGALGGMLAGLGINPWLLGIAAIGAAIFGLVMMFRSSKTAAQEFGDSAKQALSASSIADFGNTVSVQTKAAQAGLHTAKAAFDSYATRVGVSTKTTQDYSRTLTRMNTIVPGTAAGIASMQSKVKGWQDALNGIQQGNQQFNSNLQLIAKTAGVDLPTAMNMANQAGLTTKQLMNDQGIAAQEDALQVAGLVRAYSSLVDGVGGVNTAYHAMNIQNSQTMKDAQQVAGAFANYTSLITGGASAFDTFVQGQATLATNLTATGKNAGAATISLGKLKDKISVAGASLDGLSPAAVTANQAFLQQVNNSQALYGSLLQLAAASGNTRVAQNNLSIAGKDMIATLLHTAGGSKAAQQQIYSLAQTFGYTGKNTLPALVKWLGTTGDKTRDLQKRMNGLTAGAGNMANAAKALSGEMSGQLNKAMSQSIIDAEGGQAAFNKFAGAVRKWQANQSANNYEAIVKQGQNLKQVFISSAGSAKAAEPILANYMMQLGVHNQKQAKAMADRILGLGSAATKTKKPVETLAQKFMAWAKTADISANAASNLWDTLKHNNFSPLSGNVDNNKKKFMGWASQMGINKKKAADLWNQLLNNNLAKVNAQVDGNKNKFFNLMKQMGQTRAETQKLWDKMKEAPHVKPTIAMQASTSGQVQAVAAAPGAAKQTIGRLYFSAGVMGRAVGGKIPGWHNTGDNLMASSPGGPIALQGGEAIVPKHLATNPEFTSFAKKRGIPGFASGGLVGSDSILNMTNNIPKYRAQAGSALATQAAEVMKANTNAAYNSVIDAFGMGKKSELKTSNSFVNTMSDDAKQVYSKSSVLGSMSVGSGTPVNYSKVAGVTQWLPVVYKALALNNEPNSLAGNVLRQILSESGGNPNAINNYDINAQHGDPSKGLLQTIGATFRAFHVAGTSGNIYDPLANVAAAINYAKHRYGPGLMSGGMGLGSGHGYAAGGKIPTANKQIVKLQHQHDRYAAAYHHHIALMNRDKSKSAKAYQRGQAEHYAQLISQVNREIAFDKAAKLKMPKPTNTPMRLAEAISAPPWVGKFTAGSGSTSPLGWALQPILGDLMIAQRFGPSGWLGKSSIDPQATSVMANWIASMQTVGGYFNSAAGLSAAQLAGKATGIHGRQTQGPKKSFLTGGTMHENVLGLGPSGDMYKFHSGDKVTGPAIAATAAAQGGMSQEDRMILLAMLAEAKRANQIAAQQGREVAKAINGNAGRKIGRP